MVRLDIPLCQKKLGKVSADSKVQEKSSQVCPNNCVAMHALGDPILAVLSYDYEPQEI